MKAYRKIKWFKHERFYNLLRSPFLQIAYFSLLFSDKYYNKVNAKHIQRFHEVYDGYVPTPVEYRVTSDLENDGIAFARIEEFFGPDMLARLQLRFDRLEQRKGEAYMRDPSSYSKILDLNGDLCEDPAIAEWVMSRSFLNIASLYLQLVPRCGTKQEYVVIATPNEKRGAQLWHRDGSDKKIAKVFVYLNDVSEDNGPFHFIRGTHYKGILRDVMSWTSSPTWPSTDRSDGMLDRYDPLFEGREVVCTGSAGTVIFADTSGFHRGGFCRSGFRRMIELSFYSNAAFISHGRYRIPASYAFPEDPALRLAFGLD